MGLGSFDVPNVCDLYFQNNEQDLSDSPFCYPPRLLAGEWIRLLDPPERLQLITIGYWHPWEEQIRGVCRCLESQGHRFHEVCALRRSGTSVLGLFRALMTPFTWR